jgi:hypothetical protein
MISIPKTNGGGIHYRSKTEKQKQFVSNIIVLIFATVFAKTRMIQ